jgi:hypothetical protein
LVASNILGGCFAAMMRNRKVKTDLGVVNRDVVVGIGDRRKLMVWFTVLLNTNLGGGQIDECMPGLLVDLKSFCTMGMVFIAP